MEYIDYIKKKAWSYGLSAKRSKSPNFDLLVQDGIRLRVAHIKPVEGLTQPVVTTGDYDYLVIVEDYGDFKMYKVFDRKGNKVLGFFNNLKLEKGHESTE